MFEKVVIATDGSDSAKRGIRTAIDLADRFEATVHALSVHETSAADSTDDHCAAAVEFVRDQTDGDVETAVREGEPATEIVAYADDVEADVIAIGTRGRHGEHAFLLGSVAEAVVRDAPMPVLTVRQLAADEAGRGAGAV